MHEALEVARKGMRDGLGGPFGSLVVRDGLILSSGCNRVLADQDPTAHAEITAIREACRKLGSFQLNGCDLYCSCEPCPMCLGAIYWARPRRVFYAYRKEDAEKIGFDDALIYKQLRQVPELRSIPMIATGVPDRGRLFRDWQEQNPNTLY